MPTQSVVAGKEPNQISTPQSTIVTNTLRATVRGAGRDPSRAALAAGRPRVAVTGLRQAMVWFAREAGRGALGGHAVI